MLILIFIVFGIISFAVSQRLKNKFKKYSQIPLKSNMSGKEVADAMLRQNGIYDVKVTSVPGKLTDHYNPSTKTVNLSEEVYYGRSVASAAVAAHECGHAVQHAVAYGMLELRSALVPVQNVSGKILNFVVLFAIFGGAVMMNIGWTNILLVIIACYFILTLFSFITLPVEFDASKRALAWIEKEAVVSPQEHDMAKDSLKWAAMTYVVAALGSLVTLLYYISMFLGARD